MMFEIEELRGQLKQEEAKLLRDLNTPLVMVQENKSLFLHPQAPNIYAVDRR